MRISAKIQSYFRKKGFQLYKNYIKYRLLCLLSGNIASQGWLGPHIEVWSVALHALKSLGVPATQAHQGLLDLISKTPQHELKSYWWAEDHYLLAVLSLVGEYSNMIEDRRKTLLHHLLGTQHIGSFSTMTLALLLAFLGKGDIDPETRCVMRTVLAERQQQSGEWTSRPLLRIPKASSHDPWTRDKWKIDRPGPWAVWSESDSILTSSVAVAALVKEEA